MKISPQKLIELSTGYWKSRAFLTALEMGVFRELGSRAMSAIELASKLECDHQRLRPLLGVLIELDLMESRLEDDMVQATELSRTYLDPNSPFCMEGAFLYASEMYGLWGELEGKLKSGVGEQPKPTKADTPAFLAGMEQRVKLLAPGVLPLLGLPARAKVLDVAAGAGAWSRLLLEKEPGLKVTLLEQPEIISSLRPMVESGQWGTTELLEGDYHNLNEVGEYDVVMFFGALHQDPKARLVQVLEQCWGAVAPGGQLWILDIFALNKKGEDLFAWLFGLNMSLTTEGGVMVLSEVEAACSELPGQCALSVRSIPVDLPYHLLQVRKEI